LIRGGDWNGGAIGGVFTVSAHYDPSASIFDIGFRCAR